MKSRKPSQAKPPLDLCKPNRLSRRRFIQTSALAMVALPGHQPGATEGKVRKLAMVIEGTGSDPSDGHRIIEIALVGLEDDEVFDQAFHAYLDPEREVCPGAEEVHGIGREQLAGLPRFSDIARDIHEQILGSHLIVIRSSFTLGLLDAEFQRAGLPSTEQACANITEIWSLAKRLWPSEKNDIDSIAARLKVPLSNRDALGMALQLARTFAAMGKHSASDKLYACTPSDSCEPCLTAVLVPGKFLATLSHAELCDFNGAVTWRLEDKRSKSSNADICFEATGTRSLRLSVPDGSAARKWHHVDFNVPGHDLATSLIELVRAIFSPPLEAGLIGVDIDDVWAVLQSGNRGYLLHPGRPPLHETVGIRSQFPGRVGGIISTTYLPAGERSKELLDHADYIVEGLCDTETFKLAGAPFVMESTSSLSLVILEHDCN